MCKLKDAKEKLNKVKEKVDADLSNGRHKQKRIKAKIREIGLTEQVLIESVAKIAKA